MRWIREWGNAACFAFGWKRKQRELDGEMNFHLQEAIDDLVDQGHSPEAARKMALREFGGVEKMKEECRDSWGARVVMDLIRDIRYSTRSLWRSKGFSVAVFATIALCIGANTTVFSVLYGLILKPLPFENPDRVVHIYNAYRWGQKLKHSNAGWSQYLDFNEHADLFEGFALARSRAKILDGVEVNYRGVTSEFFDLLGAEPILGRFFSPEEVYPGPGNVVVLTQTAWENDYLGDPDIVGKEITFLLGPPHTIVGVAPRSVESIDTAARFFLPLTVRGNSLKPSARMMPDTDLWARLKPGVSHTQAYEQLALVEVNALKAHNPRKLTWMKENNQSTFFEIDRPHPLKSSLELLQVGTLFLVVVGCINIFNLLLTRSMRRCPEFSVRYSFGARRFTLGRILLCESVILVLVGLGIGLLLAWGSIAAINGYLAALFPSGQLVEISSAVLFWTLLMALAVALIVGLLPLALLWKSGRIQTLDTSTRSSSVSRNIRFFSNSLVVSQIAITFVLLIGAGLLTRSFLNVLDVDPGFDASHVVSGHVNLRPVYPDKQDWVGARTRVLETMREISGVENVSFQWIALIVGQTGFINDRFLIQGGSADGDPEPPSFIKFVNGEFFATMGIDILEGRTFYPGVDEASTSCIVDESFANRYLKDRIVLGSQVKRDNLYGWQEIVGVAARVNFQGLENRDGWPVLYMCHEKVSQPNFTLLVRTKRSTESMILEVQSKLREIDSRLYLRNATSLDRPLDNLHKDREGMTLLTGVFAFLALSLSAIGIYGIVSYDVEQRQREIGIRSAIGASQLNVIKMIIRQGFLKTSIGMALGLLASLYLTRFLEGQLFDIAALDLATYSSTIGFLIFVAMTASGLPACRAVRLDPLESLRVE